MAYWSTLQTRKENNHELAIELLEPVLPSSRLLLHAAPVLDLGLRLFLANVFFKSGLTKIQTWDSTLYLFREEYKVPLLPPDFAAWLGTGAELTFPVLLVFGLFGRFGALGLTILNAVAAYSYYDH